MHYAKIANFHKIEKKTRRIFRSIGFEVKKIKVPIAKSVYNWGPY